ncbi:MAG: DUF2851 family protein [Thermomicrobiales bacterium]|nr:DUF2851 family protein [Thermomicrobiales bacterium]
MTSPASHAVEESSALPELAISHWWRHANLNEPLVTTDGEAVRIVFRGVWSHGNGPDFRDAMIALGDRELRAGSIEIHRHAADWRSHGHDRDPAYNDVVLHVVLMADTLPTRRADGATIPVVIAPATPTDLRAGQSDGWSMVGGEVCAAELAVTNPKAIRDAVDALGDLRLGHKSAQIEARLVGQEPGEVLFQEIMESLGYTANRQPMRALGQLVPLQALTALAATQPAEHRRLLPIAALLGAGGFLPLSQSLQEIARLSVEDVPLIERLWTDHLTAWHNDPMAPTRWNLTRVRPLNHPVRRITAAALIASWNDGALVASVLDLIRGGSPVETALVDAALWRGQRLLGEGRAIAVVTNAMLPFAMALAAHTGDDDLSEATSRAWEHLPGEEPNQITRRAQRQIAGDIRLGSWNARGMQGLIHLDSALCTPRRCFECPIAHLVVRQTP